MPDAIDLFGGAGGATLALERCGYRAVAYDVWDAALAAHHANLLRAIGRDLIAEPLRREDTGTVALLWASPPCQPFSSAGKGQGELDERDGMRATVASIASIQPTRFIIENVANLAGSSHRRYLEVILDGLRDAGYAVEHRVLDAADYGVPQHRRRLIIQGRRDGGSIAWPTPTHGPAMGHPHLTVRQAIDVDARYDDLGAIITYAKRPVLRPSQYAGYLVNGGGRHLDPDAPAPTICATTGGNRTPWIDRLGVMGEYHRGLLDGTLEIRSGRVPGGRRLTLKELATLMGFPVDSANPFIFPGTKSDQHALVGNAVPPALAEAIIDAGEGGR